MRDITDGPYGGTRLRSVGEQTVGSMLTDCEVTAETPWGGVRSSDYSVAQVAHSLGRSLLWAPRSQSAGLHIPITTLASFGTRGWHDINMSRVRERRHLSLGTRRRPRPLTRRCGVTSAEREIRILCEADSQLEVTLKADLKTEPQPLAEHSEPGPYQSWSFALTPSRWPPHLQKCGPSEAGHGPTSNSMHLRPTTMPLPRFGATVLWGC